MLRDSSPRPLVPAAGRCRRGARRRSRSPGRGGLGGRHRLACAASRARRARPSCALLGRPAAGRRRRGGGGAGRPAGLRAGLRRPGLRRRRQGGGRGRGGAGRRRAPGCLGHGARPADGARRRSGGAAGRRPAAAAGAARQRAGPARADGSLRPSRFLSDSRVTLEIPLRVSKTPMPVTAEASNHGQLCRFSAAFISSTVQMSAGPAC